MKAKSDLHAPMGAAEKAVGDRDGVSPHYVEHPEKATPRHKPAGHHVDSTGEVLQTLDQNPAPIPVSNPQGADAFIEHPEKQKTFGHADHESARGRGYDYSEVDTSDHSHNRSEHVPINEDAGSIGSSGNKSRRPNTRCEENVSSFGGRKYKA